MSSSEGNEDQQSNANIITHIRGSAVATELMFSLIIMLLVSLRSKRYRMVTHLEVMSYDVLETPQRPYNFAWSVNFLAKIFVVVS